MMKNYNKQQDITKYNEKKTFNETVNRHCT